MGTPTTRIASEDFLTPPELSRYQLAANAAGRIGGVRLELVSAPVAADRRDKPGGSLATRLGACYQQVPLRVLPPFQFGAGQPALLYLLNPTAGLMDGDGQLVDLTARAGTRCVVVGQSATRIHPCLHGFATQQWRLRVETGAVLVVLPGPALPFRGCRYYQRVTVDLEEGAGFVWGDVWLPGRYARGKESEWFQFATMIQELTIRRGGGLVFRDRGCWQGPWGPEEAAWHFGDATAAGSLFVTGPLPEELLPDGADRTQARSASAETGLSDGAQLRLAHLKTAAGDTCVRWCGSSEVVIAQVVRTALAAAALQRGDPLPWLTGTDLAPAHWFSAGVRS
jgi:urease accessory protein